MIRKIPTRALQVTMPDAALETRSWIVLESLLEIEAWIERLNYDLQQLSTASTGHGQGVCLKLTEGGTITLHTGAEGNVLLDVDSDAAWATPLIVAATGVPLPRGTIWHISGDRLIELMMGLNSLIASEQLILRHNFRT